MRKPLRLLLTLCALLSACSLPAPSVPHIRFDPEERAEITPVADRPYRPTSAEPTPTPATAAGPIQVTVQEAVLMSLENNRALRVERLNPAIQRTFIEEERAVFEPIVSAEVAGEVGRFERRTGDDFDSNLVTAAAAVSEFLPTGTEIELSVTTDRVWGDLGPDQHATRLGLAITQALLEGRGLGPNLVALRQARIDARLSDYELRGFAEALVADVETTYWDYALARREVEIFEESLKLAAKQLDDTQKRIKVGTVAETELAAAEAEVALRREGLIDARSRLAALRVRLLRLIRPDALVDQQVELLLRSEPLVPPSPLADLKSHLDIALMLRPDLNQARLLIQRGQLDIVRTRNGLLPRMDLFINLGKTGYADSFGGSIKAIPDDGYDVAAGVIFQYPLTNRADRAQHERARLSLRQARESLRNVTSLIHEDVMQAYIEVNRARQQVDATAATRRLQEETLRAETAKFNVGKSTALLVAQAQRDLLAGRVAEVEAVANYLNALTVLFRLDGSLLVRRQIVAPGREPVGPRAWAGGIDNQ